jgi:hypothetical protein
MPLADEDAIGLLVARAQGGDELGVGALHGLTVQTSR